MKTSRAVVVGGAAAAILATGWATSPRPTGQTYTAAAETDASRRLVEDLAVSRSASPSAAASVTESSSAPSEPPSEQPSVDGSKKTSTPKPTTTKTSTPKPTTTKTSTPKPTTTKTSTPKPTTTKTSTPKPTTTKTSTPKPTTASVSGSFTGKAVQTSYGVYQVAITVSDGKVTKVSMVQNGLNDEESTQIKSYAVPKLINEVLSAQSPKVSYISGASYTSQGFVASVTSAFSKAGL